MTYQLKSDEIALTGPDSDPVQPQRYRLLTPESLAALENTTFEPVALADLTIPPDTNIPTPTLVGFLVGLGAKLSVNATKPEIFSAIRSLNNTTTP